MEIILQIIFIIIGFVILVKSADIFLDGAINFAYNFKIPAVIVGLTIVAFGTSAPEAAISILTIVGMWKIMVKAGYNGWESLIPFYNRYLLYKKCWNGSYYFAALAMIIPAAILGVSSYIIYTGGYGYSFGIVLGVLAMITAAVPFVMNLILSYKISKSFGHGLLFTAGYVLMTDLFTLILGFGDEEFRPELA